MSAEQYGARLLGDVQEETLQDLLKSLQNTIDPHPKALLGFEQIDRLLELFRYHQAASPARHLGWTSSGHYGPGIGSDDLSDTEGVSRHAINTKSIAKTRSAVIEVTATKSASGKTTLLHHLTAISLLPTNYGGKASAVIWLDTDGRFSALRLSQTIASSLSKHDPGLQTPHRSVLVTSALTHLHIVKPTSSHSLLTYLQQLPTYLLLPTNPSTHRQLGLLVLDSATAFQHQDRLDAELIRLSNPTIKSNDHPSRTSEIITALRDLQTRFSCTILFTTTRGIPSSRSQKSAVPEGVAEEAAGINPWTAFASLTLHVNRLPIAQFASSMTLDECLRDREKRQEAVSRGRVRTGVDVERSESELWPIGVKEKVLSLAERGAFVVRLNEGGMEVDMGGTR